MLLISKLLRPLERRFIGKGITSADIGGSCRGTGKSNVPFRGRFKGLFSAPFASGLHPKADIHAPMSVVGGKADIKSKAVNVRY
jgi:hypothetical protein